MSTMQPIADKHDLKKAAKHIKANYDPAYSLIWHIGIESGLRVTDLTELEYCNIDFEAGTVTVAENKGSRANKARARLRVLEQVKLELIGRYSDDSKRMMGIFVSKAKDIYDVIPEELKPLVDARIKDAMNKAKPKMRTTRLTQATLTKIKARQKKYSAIDDGFLFSRATMRSSNRAKNITGVITRQSCYRVFSSLTAFMATLGKKLKIACHSLRKIFAFHLYTSSGNDIGLLMSTIGHSTAAMSLRYIGIGDAEKDTAVENMFAYFDN